MLLLYVDDDFKNYVLTLLNICSLKKGFNNETFIDLKRFFAHVN